jgi:murein DD-endopeptidase MepM/ murein hydrolase activator NlpD
VPDFWCRENDAHEIFESAGVSVAVDGVSFTLPARPYQYPVEVNGLRLLVETTQPWALKASYEAMNDVARAVRFSAVAAGEAWGPETIRFPILGYRWRSSTYNNTWLQIVPYNHLYYHRGEDYGAIPDRLDVVAPLDGTVTASPLPDGDGASNSLAIRHADGMEVRFAHMNVEHLAAAAAKGGRVGAGTVLGRTGCTWSGSKSQHSDPHLHVGFRFKNSKISPFPFLAEAYFRDYPDALMPNAGGYLFTTPGRPVRLDASRSLARPGRRVAAYCWQLQDGRRVAAPVAETIYDRPGLYSERLTVTADDGSEDIDFLQVRVFDPARGRDMARGWVHMHPGRGLAPGRPALFWNRLQSVEDALIDFGDGTPPERFGESAEHAYARPGLHVATVTGRGPGGEPVAVQLRVIVGKGTSCC